jgi:hypothetical protein
VESERLEAAQEMDGKYHLAKLIARAFNDPESLWREHEEIRQAMLAPHQPEPPRGGLPPMEQIVAIHQKMLKAGLIQPTSGAMN